MVVYAYSPALIQAADQLPSNVGRASRVHTLIEAFGVLDHVDVVEPKNVSAMDLCKYHDRDFVNYLLNAENENDSELDGSEADEDLQEEYGLQYDCPVFDGLQPYVQQIAGATLSCAESLLQDGGVAINWTGGRHHARRAKAAGFCYVNDAVLGILKLRTKYDRVMYIDLDLHHGDGVEAAFASSANVMCVSVHKYATGFYPGTGGPHFTGKGVGEGYTVNIPGDELDDGQLVDIFHNQISPIKDKFRPNAIVMLLGADGLTKDEHREWKLTYRSFDTITQEIITWDLPTLVLGGGGYNHTETAKCWTFITAGVAGLDSRWSWQDIPDHSYYDDYAGDAFQFQNDL